MSFDFIDQKFGQKSASKRAPTESTLWWCDDCNEHISDCLVSEGRHDEMSGGCGCFVEPWCRECDNGGWVQVHSERPPMFGECPKCYNPNDHGSP